MEHSSRRSHHHSRPRYDAYATPLPSLSEARVEDMSTHPQNRDVRQRMLAHLDELLCELLRRGSFAEVTIRVTIQDGALQRAVHVSTARKHQYDREEE